MPWQDYNMRMDSSLPKQLNTQLGDLPLAAVRYYDQIGSTNDEALSWLNQGAQDGSLVVADRQDAGRGRLARRWVTRPGVALAFSLILRPSAAEARQLARFSLLAGLAVQQALETDYTLPAEIKWPNDILIRGGKVAGILAESAWEGNQPLGAVIGIGINVAAAAVPPQAELRFPAASLEQALGYLPDRWAVLKSIIHQLLTLRPLLVTPALRTEVERRLAFRGQQVIINSGTDHAYQGHITGLDDDGNLCLTLRDGKSMKFSAGEVSLRPVTSGGNDA